MPQASLGQDNTNRKAAAYDIEQHGYKQGQGVYSEEEPWNNDYDGDQGPWHKNEESDTEVPGQEYK